MTSVPGLKGFQSNWKIAFAVLGVLVLVNAAYATSVPRVLEAFTPAPMPWGYREAASPEGDAGAVFVDVTNASGIDFARYAWSAGDLPYPAVVGGGVAAADVDRDGFVDLYFTPGGPAEPAGLYRNNGDWTFTDVADAAGLADAGFGTGAAFADYDNDGDADLFAFIGDGGRLYENDGDGVFTDVTENAGVHMRGACGERACQGSSVLWFDHDQDGDLDLYVVNNLDWRQPGLGTSGQDYASLIYFAGQQLSVLYSNNGDGTFTVATDAAGIPNTGKGLGAVAVDLNGDGLVDVATANDITENAAYINLGDGLFRSAARSLGLNELKTSMGIAAGDVDGDGDVDVVISNFRGHKLSLLAQGDAGKFAYETDARGLGASWRGTGWGVALVDYDLDGWLDVAHAVGRAVPLDPHKNDVNNLVFRELVEDSEDQLFRNLGNGSFAEVTYTAGDFAGRSTTRAILAVDLDNDGDEDVVRVNVQGEKAEILRNDRAGANRAIQLTLEGTGASNRDAIGAKVLVTLPDGREVVRDKQSAAGYQTGLSPVVTIGIGEHEDARVRVLWPSGAEEDFGTLAAGRHALEEGTA